MEYNPRNERYWDETALADDMKVAFDVCNGCRLCFSLCPSFPELFDAVEGHDDNVDELTKAEMDRVTDLCFQCKLCYVKCPYTPPHRFDLDFPRLLLRSKAVRVKKEGMSQADKFLGDPEKSGKLGMKMPGLSNWGLTNAVVRRLMQKRWGIDRRRHLPRFRPVSFSEWVAKHHRGGTHPDAVDVAIFSTCTVEYHENGIGEATLAVLGHNEIKAAVPKGQQCCGMPALDGGDIIGATERAKQNVALLAPYAREGKKILALQPTCAYVLKKEYPLLLGTDDAELVSKNTQDVTEYLADRMKKKDLRSDFSQALGTVTYHMSCHTKAQGLVKSARTLLAGIEGTQFNVVDRCAGIDGTWGLKAEYFDHSQKVAKKMTEAFAQAHDTHACSDCSLAGLQIETVTDKPPRHPVELLYQAYGLDTDLKIRKE